ncbi:MAG: hypothetical protein ACHQ9S_27105 [Candidatus Binatia bacterium]
MSWAEGDRINAAVLTVVATDLRAAGCPVFLVEPCCSELEAAASKAYDQRDAEQLTAALSALAQHLVAHATAVPRWLAFPHMNRKPHSSKPTNRVAP